jgi:spore germination protein GerM
MRRSLRLLAGIGVLATVTTACSIQPDAAPQNLPAERTAVFGEPATGDEAAGQNRIYLLAPAPAGDAEVLRSVPRDVPTGARAVLESLFAGPNVDERSAQLDTAMPADVRLLSTRTVGDVLTIDLNDAFDDLTTVGLRQAVAQIVITATDIEGIRAVQLRVDGEPRVWPRGNGELTDRPLTAFDFPGLVESTQPEFPGAPSARS